MMAFMQSGFAPFNDARPLTEQLLQAYGFTQSLPATDWLSIGNERLNVCPAGPVGKWFWSIFDNQQGQTFPFSVRCPFNPETVGDLRWLCWRMNIELQAV